MKTSYMDSAEFIALVNEYEGLHCAADCDPDTDYTEQIKAALDAINAFHAAHKE